MEGVKCCTDFKSLTQIHKQKWLSYWVCALRTIYLQTIHFKWAKKNIRLKVASCINKSRLLERKGFNLSFDIKDESLNSLENLLLKGEANRHNETDEEEKKKRHRCSFQRRFLFAQSVSPICREWGSHLELVCRFTCVSWRRLSSHSTANNRSDASQVDSCAVVGAKASPRTGVNTSEYRDARSARPIGWPAWTEPTRSTHDEQPAIPEIRDESWLNPGCGAVERPVQPAWGDTEGTLEKRSVCCQPRQRPPGPRQVWSLTAEVVS